MTTNSDIEITRIRTGVGQYLIGSDGAGYAALRLSMTVRPNWWHRFWTRVFLGWVWEEAR